MSRTIELNSDYDIFVKDGNLALHPDNLTVIRQGVVNKLSLVKGEDVEDSSNGLNLSIMFGDSISFDNKIAEIRRVIYLCPGVVSVDNIAFVVDKKLRVGYFTCYITVTVDGEQVQTTVDFGV